MTPDELKAELDCRNLGPWQAASVIGLSYPMVWRILNGQRGITSDRAELIRLRLAEYDAQGNGNA